MGISPPLNLGTVKASDRLNGVKALITGGSWLSEALVA